MDWQVGMYVCALNLDKFERCRSKFVRKYPTLGSAARHWPTRAPDRPKKRIQMLGPMSDDLDEFGPGAAQIRADSDQVWPELDRND